MKLKNITLALAISLSGVTAVNTANAGIPVIDAGSIAQAVVQVQHLRDQIQNQMLYLFSHNRSQ